MASERLRAATLYAAKRPSCFLAAPPPTVAIRRRIGTFAIGRPIHTVLAAKAGAVVRWIIAVCEAS